MDAATHSHPACSTCSGPAIGWGKDRNGNKRLRCPACRRTWTVLPVRPLGSMRLPVDRAVLCLSLLVDGSSMRAAERVTGHHRRTLGKLLVLVGGKCEALLDRLIVGVEVKDVQADEVWSFIRLKERTKARRKISDPKVGDAYTFTAIDRDSKLCLAWHLGRRTNQHTDLFCEKLARATAGHFQLTTDGFASYPAAVDYHLGGRTDYATLIKHYAQDGTEEQRRYSPPRIIGLEKAVVHGNPEEARICTSHVERQNLSMRTAIKRMTRLTCAFSKKWDNHKAALALYFAHYNLVRMHRSIRMTPAMKAGVTRAPWSLADLVAA